MIVKAVELSKQWKGAIRYLQTGPQSDLFMSLNESSLRGWFDPDTFALLPKVRERWLERKPPSGRTGRPYLLADVPETEAFIIDTVRALRLSGSTINSIAIASVMKSVLAARSPELLEKLSISRRWCRAWMKRRLGWTYKKATTSGQKLPDQWQQLVKDMAVRVTALIAVHNITQPCFVVNWDQTGVLLLQCNKYTYHNIKEKQVPVIGLEEKRQITTVVASALSGELLPLQLVFAGQDRNKKQQRSVPTLDPVTNARVLEEGWHLTQTHNHWSSLESMKDYVRSVIVPFVDKKRQQHSCPGSHVVLLFDCWSVHKSDPFMTWLTSSYPLFHPVFVPAGCTAKAQPADIILQRPLKSVLMNEYTTWMTPEMKGLLDAGATP